MPVLHSNGAPCAPFFLLIILNWLVVHRIVLVVNHRDKLIRGINRDIGLLCIAQDSVYQLKPGSCFYRLPPASIPGRTSHPERPVSRSGRRYGTHGLPGDEYGHGLRYRRRISSFRRPGIQ